MDTDPQVEVDPPVVEAAAPPSVDPAQTPPLVPAPSISIPPTPTPIFDLHSSDEINFLKTVLGPKAWAARRARTADHLEKVMTLARTKGTIDRTDVRRHTQDDNVYTIA